ncbi:MAG: hypothetical protein ACI83O_000484 [Patescibacteria group bacterium]|jgi:hypothetical protein
MASARKRESLFLSLDAQHLRQARIHLLSAQSNVLMGRERVKRLVSMTELEHTKRISIASSMGKVIYAVRRFKGMIPKPQKHKNKHKKIMPPREVVIDSPIVILEPEIRSEMDVIVDKLRELGVEV